MDSESGNVKRKRGRPSAIIPNELQADRASKKKRVELSKSSAPEVAENNHVSEDLDSRNRKRGRPSNAGIAEKSQDNENQSSSPRASRKERVNYAEKRKYGTQEKEVEEKEEEGRGSRGNKRVDYGEKRKYSLGNQENGESSKQVSQKTKQSADKSRSAPVSQEIEPVPSGDTGKKSRAGRPSRSSQAELTRQEDEQPKSTADKTAKRKQNSQPKANTEEEHDQRPKKRGRPSLTGVGQVASENEQPTLKQPTKRRGRPSNSLNNANEPEENEAEPPPLKKRRGRPSNADNETIPPENHVNQTRTKKIKSREEDNNPAEARPKQKKQRRNSPELEPEKQNTEIAHQRLVPQEHKINRSIIDTKWNLLPPTAISRVSTLLHEAERPVLHRFQTPSSRTLAQTAISTIIHKVERKLRKGLPFPPPSNNGNSHREEDFDLERIMRHNRALESQLTVLGHSNDLLIADRKKEEALLEAEMKALRRLEKGVKEEEVFNRAELRKKEHALLKDVKIAGGKVEDEISLVDKARVDLTKLQQDEDLAPVIKQMHGHLDSMQGNTEQINGIGAAIMESRAAVEDVLWKRVDEMQYGQVVLG